MILTTKTVVRVHAEGTKEEIGALLSFMLDNEVLAVYGGSVGIGTYTGYFKAADADRIKDYFLQLIG